MSINFVRLTLTSLWALLRSTKIVGYNEALTKANKLLQQQNGELQSTKRQIVSIKEANQNKDAEIVKLKQRLQTTESKMHTSLTLVSTCKHIRYIVKP